MVKTIDSNRNGAIRHESELVHQFSQLVGDERELHWQIPLGQSANVRLSSIELEFDGKTIRFKPVYLLKPSIPELESVLKDWTDPAPPLLIVPELTPRILDFCRHNRLGAVDLNGRIYIRGEGLLVDRRALPDRKYRFELEPRNVFVGKSAQIIRTLLTNRDQAWGQSEVVRRTKASPGLVSRIIQHLNSQGFIERRSSREFRLRDPLGLIDAWARADDFGRRTTCARYTIFNTDAFEIAQQLKTWGKEQSVSIAFTQWIAAWLRHPYAEPLVTSAYVGQLPDPAVLERLGLRPVNDAGKVWLYVPSGENIFLETQVVKDLPLVTDAQIYLDLLPTGLRGPDAAADLKNWKGFCRP